MALPLTLENIQTEFPAVQLQFKEYAATLPLLTQQGGLSRTYNGQPAQVSIDWHRDDADTIQGIFVCIYTKNIVDAYAFKKPGPGKEKYYDRLTVEEGKTDLVKNTFYRAKNLQPLLSVIATEEPAEKVTFEAMEIKDLETIKTFFAKSPGMLPEPLRTQLFPSTPKPKDTPHSPSDKKEEHNYFYIAGGVLLLLGVAYVAKQYFAKAKPAQG